MRLVNGKVVVLGAEGECDAQVDALSAGAIRRVVNVVSVTRRVVDV